MHEILYINIGNCVCKTVIICKTVPGHEVEILLGTIYHGHIPPQGFTVTISRHQEAA